MTGKRARSRLARKSNQRLLETIKIAIARFLINSLPQFIEKILKKNWFVKKLAT